MSKGYPSDWDRRRKRVYKRDNYQCQNCGAKGGPRGHAELHAHHIVPKSRGGTHQLSNLKTMCADCHDAIHGNSVAPTGHSQSRDSDVDAENFFGSCPFCHSTQIGKGNREDIAACPNCGVKFKVENQFAGKIVEVGDGLFGVDPPPDDCQRVKEVKLSPAIWHRIGGINDPSQLDFKWIEKQHGKETIKNMLLALMVLVVVSVSSFLISDSILLAIFLGPALGAYAFWKYKKFVTESIDIRKEHPS